MQREHRRETAQRAAQGGCTKLSALLPPAQLHRAVPISRHGAFTLKDEWKMGVAVINNISMEPLGSADRAGLAQTLCSSTRTRVDGFGSGKFTENCVH